MTTNAEPPDGNPRDLLSSSRDLARRVRQAQRATWFPLLVLAAVTFVSIPVYRYAGIHLTSCVPSGPDGRRICTAYSNAELAYWPIALLIAYGAIAAFYIRRSRSQGLETRIRPYVIAGIVIAAVLTGAALWEAHTGPSVHGIGWLSGFEHRLVTPETAIGLALLVLAWAERNRALLVLTIGYLAVLLIPINFGWTTGPRPNWFFLPQLVIYGCLLLAGGVGFALAQRPLRSPAL